MPRVARRHKARRSMPQGAVLQLRTGRDFLRNGFGNDADDATLRAAWEVLHEQVMEEHRRHHENGWPARPWAWWRFVYTGPPVDLGPVGAHWAEASALLDLGELEADEIRRMPRLIAAELKCRTDRVNMIGGREALDSIRDLKRRFDAAHGKAD